jgi:hypothetical protein
MYGPAIHMMENPMSTVEALPIACTLAPGESKDRRSLIAALNKDALLDHRLDGRVLTLTYAPDARTRVRELVKAEQTCCAFLRFDLLESTHAVRLTITAPETAGEGADGLFEQFLAQAPRTSASLSSCTCASLPLVKEPPGAKAAGAAAITLSTGAIACGACCVLPFTLPATVLASTGSVISSLVHMHWWVTALSVISVISAWAWLAWQIRRTGRKPAISTVAMMTVSTLFMTIAVMWPLIEKPLIRALRV